jgi:hypothetical protein
MEHWKVCNECTTRERHIPEGPRKYAYNYGDYHKLLNKHEEWVIKYFRLKELWTETNAQVEQVIRKNQELEAHNKELEHILAGYSVLTAEQIEKSVVK